MATLPTYQSSEQLRTPRSAGTGDFIRKIGRDISSAVSKRQEYDTQMELAEQKNQVDLAKINTNKAVALLDERYKADPMAFKEGEYEDSLNKIRDEQSATISSTEGAAAYDLDTSFGFTKAGIGARAIRGDAVIKQGKQNTLDTLSGIGQQDVLDSSGNFNPALIKMRMQQGEKAISEAEQFKFVSPEEGDKLRKEGMTSAVLSDASRGSRYARDVMKKLQDPTDTTYPFKDPADKKAAFTQTKGLLDMMEYREEVQVADDKVLKQESARAIISDPNVKPIDKMNALKDLQMTVPEEKLQIAALNKSLGIQASTNLRTFDELNTELTQLNQLATTGALKDDPAGYMRRVEELSNKITSAYASDDPEWRIGPKHYDALIRDVQSNTSAKREQALGATTQEDKFTDWWLFSDEKWENSNVKARLKDQFPENPELGRQAYSDYYMMLDAQKQKGEDSAETREVAFDKVVAKYEGNETTQQQNDVRTAKELVGRYGQKQTDEQFLEGLGVAEAEIEQSIADGEFASREEAIQYLRDNGA